VQNSNLFKTCFNTLGLLILFIAFGLFFDSSFFITYDSDGQLYANVLMLIVFAFLFYKATKRSKELMLYALAIGVGGEYLFSLGSEMYSYRLGNVPMYVPPGHAIIYIVTVYFCREKCVKLFSSQIEKVLGILILLYSLCFLIFASDIFGFSLTILTLWLLRNRPRERLFYYSMYIVVVFLELIGTNYNCWVWPNTAFGIFDFIKSANPPSGISFFYFGLDLGCLWLYKQRHKIAWGRMKRLRGMT